MSRVSTAARSFFIFAPVFPPPRPRRAALALLVVFRALLPGPLPAQTPSRPPPNLSAVHPLLTLGSPAEERLRLLQLTGARASAGFLIRAPSSLTPEAPDSGALRWSWIAPEARLVWNSDIPFSLNDGSVWAGVGTNALLRTGFMLHSGRVRLIVAPQLVHEANRDFQFIGAALPGRSPFASPYHLPPASADLPLRFGNGPVDRIELGQSSLAVEVGPAVVGAATENQWWGPGIRNAIVMSNQASGIPRLFARTSRPMRTPLGTVAGEWMLGWLSESRFFNRSGSDDRRSISGIVATLQPAGEPDLTLGFSRVVYGPVSSRTAVLGRALDAFRDVAPPGDSAAVRNRDQLFSLFGRWVFPNSGAEVYAEWARTERPSSLRDLLEAPNHTQGYTVGLQFARPTSTSGVLRLQAEATNLEQSATYRQRPVHGFYVSRGVPQGYTHKGQVIGASIGPGASSQWLAGDYFAPGWQVGGFGGRIRWEDDAFYAQRRFIPTLLGHDVSLLAGFRGGVRTRVGYILAEWTAQKRYNYLFQNQGTSFDNMMAVDIVNHTLELSITPTNPRNR